jgi:hypothetical protein
VKLKGVQQMSTGATVCGSVRRFTGWQPHEVLQMFRGVQVCAAGVGQTVFGLTDQRICQIVVNRLRLQMLQMRKTYGVPALGQL